MVSWCRRGASGAWMILVHAQPGARRTEVVGVHGKSLKVRVAAPALEDRANDALVAWLAERFGVPRRSVALVAGARSREKRFEVTGSVADPEQALGPVPLRPGGGGGT